MSQRKLTSGEINLAKTIFKDSINYDKVRVHDTCVYPFGIQKADRAMARLNAVSFPGPTYASDFSLDSDPKKQSVFIHELVHVWQHQNKILNPIMAYIGECLHHKFNDQACYFYRLDAGKDLVQYNVEQQAAMIQDYFLLTRHGVDQSYKNRHLESSIADKQSAYESVLKNFLENPLYGRAFKNALNKKPK